MIAPSGFPASRRSTCGDEKNIVQRSKMAKFRGNGVKIRAGRQDVEEILAFPKWRLPLGDPPFTLRQATLGKPDWPSEKTFSDNGLINKISRTPHEL
uniref:hypothetical protein n=1 Tax=Ancylobacter mangrovi TaxID=2972472 RepID=UPI002163CBC0|nr:hypothetical protein [Ancylobacter mangrovi]